MEMIESEYLKERGLLDALVGSRGYGLAHEASDYDWRGVYAWTASDMWNIKQPPDILKLSGDTVYWELGKFLNMAMVGNPSVLEVLWAPQNLRQIPTGFTLIRHRSSFLSQKIVTSYRGYIESQKSQFELSLDNRQVDWKKAMHMIRLTIAGTHALKYHEILVDVSGYRDELLAIRNGSRSIAYIWDWWNCLFAEYKQASAETTLPKEPDVDKASQILFAARRDAAKWELEE